MSGRSAYVRKKITETNKSEKAGLPRSRTKPSTSSDDATINEVSMPARQDTGVGTTNARFLKFSEPVRENDTLSYRGDTRTYTAQSSDSQSGGSADGRREAVNAVHLKGPLEEFAYGRARRPVIKTEDVSGIEKSGLRSVLDKKSEEVRKGIAKTFTFGRKARRVEGDRTLEARPQSSATVRPHQVAYSSEPELTFNIPEVMSPPPPPQQYQQHAQPVEQQIWETFPSTLSPPPSTKLPPIPSPASTPPIKRWIGAGRPVQRWNKLRKDPELWDPNGDVLVFLGHRGQSPRVNPSFRLSSHIIEATESHYLVGLLREGSTEEDIHMAAAPVGAPPMLHHHGIGGPTLQLHSHPVHSQGALSRGGQPTPPQSEDASLGEADGQISYELYFPPLPNMTKVDQLRHHITTRNVFALLYHASLVGLSLHQALTDLVARLEAYMPMEADNVGTVLTYLSARGIDDVRNDAETAVSLLAWSEDPGVRWDEGWREGFLHCVGMYGRLESCIDFKKITPITRALLERACLEMQLRVQAAEERLSEFAFSDMWPLAIASTASSSGPVTTSPAKASADRLQSFLQAHYTHVYGGWPPVSPPTGHRGPELDADEDTWLTRTVAQALQKDFAALYDYLVNRDVIWDGSEARSSRKWMMVSESGNQNFEADTPDLPMTDMLIEYDNKHRIPHVPHPYPLVPDSVFTPVSVPGGSGLRDKGTTLRKDRDTGANGGGTIGGSRTGALERKVQLAYTEATNIYILGSDFSHSDLIDAFVKFEKTDGLGEVDPSTARRGRWVLIYGVLQTLASISVDSPNVRYRDGVSYHLCPRLKGTRVPPWKGSSPFMSRGGGSIDDDAGHERSHCWVVWRTWPGETDNNGAGSSAASSDGSSPVTRATYAFPRPPPTATSHSSMAGYHTPASVGDWSVRSSGSGGLSTGNYLPFSSAGSVMSESDTASSTRSPGSLPHRTRRPGNSGRSRIGSVARSTATFGGGSAATVERLDETSWPISRRNNRRAVETDSGDPAETVLVSGGFLILDDAVDDSRGAGFSTTASGFGRDGAASAGSRGAGRYGRPLLSGGGSETDSVAPMIRDFDDLDIVDEHNP